MPPVVELAGFCLALNVFAAGLSIAHDGWPNSAVYTHGAIGAALLILGSTFGRTWVVTTSGYAGGLVALSMWVAIANPGAGDVEWVYRAAMTTALAWYAAALAQPTFRFIWVHAAVAGSVFLLWNDPAGRLLIEKVFATRPAPRSDKKPHASRWGF